VQVEVSSGWGSCIHPLVGLVTLGIDAGQRLELLVCFLVESHAGSDEFGDVNIQVLVLSLDDLIYFFGELFRSAFQVQQL